MNKITVSTIYLAIFLLFSSCSSVKVIDSWKSDRISTIKDNNFLVVARAWIFHTMEKIGRTGENPFEGSANDVPISTISRGIEIDLRQNLGESLDDIPKEFPMIFDTQM